MSLNIVNKTTGDLTQVAGNATDKVGNLNALNTTDKSSCVGAINEVASGLATLNAQVNRGFVSVTADGVKTLTTLLNELYALVDRSKVSNESCILSGVGVFRLSVVSLDMLVYVFSYSLDNSKIYYETMGVAASGSVLNHWELTTTGTIYLDNSSQVPTSGVQFQLYY